MASFEISDGPVGVQLARADQGLTAKATFSVTNRLAAKKTGLLRIRPAGTADPGWFRIAGESQRVFAANETQAVETLLGIPPGTPAGDFQFQLRVVNEADPNNDWADSPIVTLRIPASDEPLVQPSGPRIFYEDDRNRIDSEFARFGSKSIAIERISAVDVETRHPVRLLALPAFAFAVWCWLYGLQEKEIVVIGLGLLVAFIGWRLWQRRKLSLMLATTGGEIRPLVTNKPAVLTAIKTALESALSA